MSKKETPAAESLNFKQMWNKSYGELTGVTLGKQNLFTPEQVLSLVVKYFEWAELTSIKAGESTAFQGKVYQDTVNKPRVFTIGGLLMFCNFSQSGWSKWKKEPGFDVVVEFANNVIREQKYQLAINGIINSTIVAKEIGIDKGDTINVSASVGVNDVSSEDVKEAVKDILSEID